MSRHTITIEELFAGKPEFDATQILASSTKGKKSLALVVKMSFTGDNKKSGEETPLVAHFRVIDGRNDREFHFGVLQNAIDQYNKI